MDAKINNVLNLCHDQAILNAVQCIIQNMIACEDASQQQLSYLQSKSHDMVTWPGYMIVCVSVFEVSNLFSDSEGMFLCCFPTDCGGISYLIYPDKKKTVWHPLLLVDADIVHCLVIWPVAISKCFKAYSKENFQW